MPEGTSRQQNHAASTTQGKRQQQSAQRLPAYQPPVGPTAPMPWMPGQPPGMYMPAYRPPMLPQQMYMPPASTSGFYTYYPSAMAPTFVPQPQPALYMVGGTPMALYAPGMTSSAFGYPAGVPFNFTGPPLTPTDGSSSHGSGKTPGPSSSNDWSQQASSGQGHGSRGSNEAARQASSSKKEKATNKTDSLTRAPINPKVWGHSVMDSQNSALQRIPVPPTAILATKGSQHQTELAHGSTSSRNSTVSKLCPQHHPPATSSDSGENDGQATRLPGVCTLGDNCPHFHIDPAYLEVARSLSEPLCCAFHNDYYSQEMLRNRCAPAVCDAAIVLRLESGEEVSVPHQFLALTIGCESLPPKEPNSNIRVVDAKKHLCRLHQQGKCKWTKDCRNIHICRRVCQFMDCGGNPRLYFVLCSHDRQAIVAALRESPDLLALTSSPCALPIFDELIEKEDREGILALNDLNVPFPKAYAAQIKESLDIDINNVAPGLKLTEDTPAGVSDVFSNTGKAFDLDEMLQQVHTAEKDASQDDPTIWLQWPFGGSATAVTTTTTSVQSG